MSGGSHNYICYTIENELCGQIGDPELDDLMKDIARLAHDLEWYHSADYGKDQYLKSVSEFKKKWFGSDREERLKGYIDDSLNSMRAELYALIGIHNNQTAQK